MNKGNLDLPVTAAEACDLFAPLASFTRLAIGVSGGADSVALMRLLAHWVASEFSAPNLHVLTVDHGLRPQSAGELALVADWAARAGLDHTGLTADGPPPRSGIQAWARDLRYRLMGDWVSANTADGVVLAHHLHDQAETLAMRLARGSGLSGLGAMRKITTIGSLRLFRPLLGVPPARLRATARSLGQDWIDDPGNLDPRYERIRLRQAMAAGGGMAGVGLDPVPLAAAAARLGRADLAVEHYVAQCLESATTRHGAGFATVDDRLFFAAPEEIRLRVLAALIGWVGGRTPALGAGLETLAAGLEDGIAGTLGGCRVVPMKSGTMIARELRGLETFTMSPGETAIWDRRFRLRLDRSGEPVQIRPLGPEGFKALRGASAELRDIPLCAGQAIPGGFSGSDLVAPPVFTAPTPGMRLKVEFCRSN